MSGRDGGWPGPSRQSLLSLTYVALAIPTMACAMLGAAGGYALASGVDLRGGVVVVHAIGLAVAMLVAIPVGLSIGGWLWAAVGKGLFGFTRSEVEAFVMRGPRIGPVVRYNEWCLRRLFRA